MEGRIFYSIFLGFVAGAFAAPFLGLGAYGAMFLALIAVASFLAGGKRAAAAALFLICAAAGMARYEIAERVFVSSMPKSVPAGKTAFSGRIVSEPEETEKNVRYTVEVSRIGGVEVRDFRILLFAGKYPAFHYGDSITFSGKLEKPGKLKDEETSSVFDYSLYLKKDGISFTMANPEIALESRGGISARSALLGAKRAVVEKIRRALSEPHASLAAGMLVGERSSLGERWKEIFRTAGVSHILVLSGYNVSIVILAVSAVFKRFRRGIYYSAVILSVIAFTVMAGGDASVVRAAVMALIAILAQSSGRRFNGFRALVAAAAAMTLSNPFLPALDVSFQLSFAATLGLLLADVLFPPAKERGVMASLLISTVAAQIAVLPIVLKISGQLSLVALPANPLILPVVPVAMAVSSAAAALGFVSGAITFPVALVSHYVISYILSVARIASSIPFSSVSIGSFSPSAVLLSYAILTALVLWKRNFAGRAVEFGKQNSN